MRAMFLSVLSLLLGAVVFLAQDFSRCVNELGVLQREAEDAVEAATSARSAAAHFRSAKNDFERCKKFGARTNSCRKESIGMDAADSYLQLARFKSDLALAAANRAVAAFGTCSE